MTVATDADVLVVGGGVAGSSAAYFAARAGRAVTVVDDGANRTSDLPAALVNPLRGHDGRLVADGVDGMHATFALVDALRADGHAIAAMRGLYRPLIDVRPDARERSFWAKKLAGSLAFAWHDVAPPSLGLVDAVPALFLPDAGWVAPVDLVGALRAASRSTVVRGRVASLDRAGATLHDGTRIAARSVLWCGGAWGAALLDADAGRDGPPTSASYKPGSLLGSTSPLTAAPVAFGLYAIPGPGGDRTTLVGPTREGSQASFPAGPLPPDVARHLGDRVGRTFGATIALHEIWRGVRLARLPPAVSAALAGVPMLTALGSRGFLMAPLLAARWARSL